MPDQQAYYIQLNQTDDTTLLSFFHETMTEVDQVKPRRLLIDLRYNFGGDGSQIPTLIRELVSRSDRQPWKDLYVLTGRKTFSAGVLLLAALLKDAPLTIVGEPPGAPLNFYGDAREIKYPDVGLRLHVSELRHQLSDSADVSEFISVDAPAVFSFADYAAGRDPAVDAILRGDEMRSVPIIAATDGGATARRVYGERKVKFAQYDWWAPPKEFDLRRICMEQVRRQRLPEALETCELTTEIHPDIWNSWYNLANAQRAAGLRQEALLNYRHVLEIDPSNFNGPRLRQMLATAAAAFKPAVIRYGATVAETQTALAGACKSLNARRIDPPFQILRDVKDRQMQLDCDGFQFLGKPRWAEFIFADDSLEMVWIMTSAEEEQDILRTMTAFLGAPTQRNSKFVVMNNERAALRLDKPEVLFYSEKLIPRVSPWFGPNSTFR
jgi:tetratricopeptide (TPR) repeat protein